jgi:hypothetical protein
MTLLNALGASLDFIISLHIQSGNKNKCSIKGGEMDWSLVSVGIFLLCLGGMIYLLSKAQEVIRRTKASAQEKGLEKKKE